MPNEYAPLNAILDHQGGSGITPPMLEALRKTKGQGLLVGILMFIAAAFTAFAVVAMVVAGSMVTSGKTGLPAGAGVLTGALYLVIALVHGALGYYLVKYSSSISRLLRDGSAEAMELALQSQRKFWRLAGVIALLSVVMFVIGMGAAIMIPLLTRGFG